MTAARGSSSPVSLHGQPRVVGRYVILNAIGRGGMASVHLGWLRGDAGFSRIVAIKRLHDNFATDPAFVDMFTDEARMASTIRHPNVVSTLDVVAHGHELFHVMDYVHGETVAKLWTAATDRRDPIPIEIAARIVGDALLGLHAAHEAIDNAGRPLGIVHRDVSPQNIIVGTDGVARVLDFGVAKARGRTQTTGDGTIKGKFGYMPPEQLYGDPVDRRTDLYAAGVVLWELLTGERLFAGRGGDTAIAAVLSLPVRRPSLVRSEVPDALDDVVLRALDREPGRRFADAQTMAEHLAAAVAFPQPSRVAAWVEGLAGDTLEHRTRLVRDAESSCPSEPFDLERTMPEARSLIRSTERTGKASLRRLPWVILGLAVAGAVMAYLLLRTPASEPVPAEASDSYSPPTPSVDPAPQASASASAHAMATPSFTESAVPKTSAPRVVRPPSPAPQPNCNPPYELDANGHRRYKRECLR